jgi:transcriptional regulator with XRE-family HTH domain
VDECHFGRNLKSWRLHRGITLRELEQRTGLKRQYLFRIERGLYKGTPNQWIRLLKELNVSIEKFTSDSGLFN